jgi:hypothetical protein
MICLLWLAQPFFWHWLVIRRSRSRIFLACLLFGTCILLLARSLHATGTATPRPEIIMLLWLPLAMLSVRYLHALAVGGDEIAHHFGLTSFTRVAIFTLCVPTVKFKEAPVVGPNGNSRQRAIFDLRACLLEMVAVVGTSSVIIHFGLDSELPDWAQRLVYAYLLVFSAYVPKLLFEIPVRFLLGNRVMIVPLTTMPYLTSSPRDVWHRWSISAGYHYRKGFSDPLGGKENRIVATVAPFFVNCVLHMFLWSFMIRGESPAYEFVHLYC